jgi:hypothetical protein
MRAGLLGFLRILLLSSAVSAPALAQSDRTLSPRAMELRPQQSTNGGAPFEENRVEISCPVTSWMMDRHKVTFRCQESYIPVSFQPEVFFYDHPICGAVAVAEPDMRRCAELYQTERLAFVRYLRRQMDSGTDINVSTRRQEGEGVYSVVRYGPGFASQD